MSESSSMPFDLPDELEEIEEQAAVVGKLTPREYARLRGMAPQMVYYYIRKGVIETEYCACGRRVVDVRQTDNDLQAQKETRGKQLDTGDTCPSFD